jgi:hypothetical protein
MSEDRTEDFPLVQTDSDFEGMNWHDCPIHALLLDKDEADLLMDIDFLWKWFPPLQEGHPFTYLISPATLVFHSAERLEISVQSASMGLRISDISRLDKVEYLGGLGYNWLIQGPHGHVKLWAVGFTQYRRQEPILSNRQGLTLEEREGISFLRGFGAHKL